MVGEATPPPGDTDWRTAMKTNQHHGGIAARLGLALIAGLLLFTPATGQETPRPTTDARPGAEVRSDEEYELLIHRLEMGMSALEELGKGDALQLMRRVTDQVREERAAAKRRGSDRRQEASRAGAARETDINVNALEQRIEILRAAQGAYERLAARDESKRERAEILKRFLHVGELLHSGAEGTVIREAYEGLDKRQIIALLRGASKVYSEWGQAPRARACKALAEYYAEREGERADLAPVVKVKKEARSWNLEERADRVEVLRFGREAHVKAGWETAAEQLGRTIRIGEMQLAGESLENVGELVEGLSMELIVEHLERASGMYREWGVGDRARLCAGLAKLYTQRDLGGEAGEEKARQVEDEEEPQVNVVRPNQAEWDRIVAERRRTLAERGQAKDPEALAEGARAADRRRLEEQINTFLRRERSARADAGKRLEQAGRNREPAARDRMQDLTKRLEVLEAKLKEVEMKLQSLNQEQRRAR